jgi:hypothetical protein
VDRAVTWKCTRCREPVTLYPDMALTEAARHAREAGHSIASWASSPLSLTRSQGAYLASALTVPAGFVLLLAGSGVMPAGGVLLLLVGVVAFFKGATGDEREQPRGPVYSHFTDAYGKTRIRRIR